MKIIFRKEGLTFVEVMVALLLFGLIAGGLYSTLLLGNVAYQNFESAVLSQQEARRTVATLARDLRMAENLTISETESGIAVNFHLPREGNVNYFWSKTGPQAGQVFRRGPKGIRTVAWHITGLEVKDLHPIVSVSVVATTVSRQGKEIKSSLETRVEKRR